METNKNWALNLCRNIRFIRTNQKIRQADLAETSGINLRYYQSIEAGKANITLDMISRIAKSLNVTSNRLVGFNSLYVDYSLENFIKKAADIFQHFSAPVVFLDTQNRINFSNHKFFESFGHRQNEIIETKIENLVRPEDRVFLEDQDIQNKSYHDISTYNVGLKRIDGKFIPVKVSPVRVVVTRKNIQLGTLLLIEEVGENTQPQGQNFYNHCLDLL